MFEAQKKGSKQKLIVMDDDPETLEWLDFGRYDVLQERFTALCFRLFRHDFPPSANLPGTTAL